jgi:hypothetical protein
MLVSAVLLAAIYEALDFRWEHFCGVKGILDCINSDGELKITGS